ncbi:Reverse transcriptase [Metarhizium robertsii ARSEF 23]|uniref:Reverse transcriptase n=1 Tax=Metarhizium robertsii (strain ARSEF 23 / ATCC MYA-3075) TaxID=655844 RepID=E9EMV0_METRA|nr:Reverse transcriptase [Metarhizium robertsii ARSEF 23]EFZ03294.1 Reverse transcriptase [Metarhizium robertsii ARSEF 23]
MVISQPATPERGAGAQLDQQYLDSFNFRARQQLLKTGPPVTLQPFQHCSSPSRSLTAYDRDRGHRRNRRPDTGTQNSSTNRFAALAEEDDATATPTPIFDLEAETEEIIKTQKERLDIRAKVLRTYADAITACTRKFTTGYGLHIANEFQSTLLRHWNQFVRAEEPLIPGNKDTHAPSSLTGTNKPTPPAPAARENTRTDKSVSFANIAKNASRQTPGDVHVHPHRRQNTTIADRTDRRVLLRLKSGSSFFEKGLQIRLALKDKLAIASQDIQDIKPTNTGWAIVARNEKIQQLIFEKQNEWGPCIDLDIAEKQIPWHTYLIKDFPKTLHSWDGTLLDFKETIEEEIEAQTGQKPERWHVSQKPNNEDPTKATLVISFLKPLNSNFRLLGQGSYSFKLTKPKKLSQCTHCWNFHPPTRCIVTKVCVRCGVKDDMHNADSCDNTTKCANCHGAHEANYENCFARPQKLRGSFQKLSKTQLIYARRLGQEDFKRKNSTQQADSYQLPPAVEQGEEDAYPLQDAEMSGTEPTQTIQAPETNSVNIVDHEGRGVDTQGEKEKEKDDEETEEEAAGEEEAEEDEEEEEEEAEEEDIEEALPPPAQSYPTGANTKHDPRVIPKHHFYITGKGASQTATNQNSTINTSTTKNPYFTIKKQFRPQPRTDDIEPPSEATARESPSEATSREIIEVHRKIHAEQLLPARHRDLLWVQVNGTTILNIYNRPEEETSLDIIESWTPPNRCVVAGDMNAFHPSWQADRRASQDGRRIFNWTQEHDLVLLNDPETSTTMPKLNKRSSTIDLVFSNIPTATATVEEYLTTGSLHYTIGTEIPDNESSPRTPGKVHVSLPEEIKAFSKHVASAAPSLPSFIRSRQDIDDAAGQLLQILQDAAKACGRLSKGKRARQNPWWSKECNEAHESLRAARYTTESRHGEEVQRARIHLKRTVRRAKRNFWRTIVADITDQADIFRSVPTSFARRSSKDGTTNLERANILRKEKLERRDVSDDIPDPWIPTASPTQQIPFSAHIPISEAQDALLRTGNTTPGMDGITTKMLQAIWPSISHVTTLLYNACLTLGYHPTPFKTAEVAMIPKLNKRDLSDISAWRPISLLSWLSKGWNEYKVLHPNQAGALPKRSATDIVTALLYDVERALGNGKMATLVTMDVKGAFDAILPNRLILRLRRQGWPVFLIWWIYHFVSHRKALVRFQDAKTEPAELPCGLPQGSPISPILYLLATTPIYSLPGATERYGYADDTAMLFVGDTLEETTAKANTAITAMETWGQQEAFSFDPDKTEVMHFSRKRNSSSPPVSHQGKEIKAQKAMRWLGVWLDRRLTFNTHIEKWSLKAEKVISQLRFVNNTVRGTSAVAARRAIYAVALPTLFYGLDTWFPGFLSESTHKGARTITKTHAHKGARTITKTHLSKLQVILNKACHAVLPVWKTTPQVVLWKEAGIPPADIILKQQQARTALRYATLDVAHPVSRRLRQAQHELDQSNHPTTRSQTLQRDSRLLRTAPWAKEVERPRLIARRFNDNIPTEAGGERPPKETAAVEFQRWLEDKPPGYVVFSDGSKTERDTAGYGYAVFHNGRLADWGFGQLGRREVFDAEIHGALEGLQCAVLANFTNEPITVCMDNTSVIDCIGATAPNSSQACFRAFQKIGDKYPVQGLSGDRRQISVPGIC